MKSFPFIFLVTLSAFSYGQQVDYNTQEGSVAQGYDVVAYFSNNAIKGSSKYTVTHDGAIYKFSSQKHLNSFNESPEKFIPQYGGWCAYAMADKSKKVSVNPKTFEIRNGKLYLFYNKFFNNTFENWNQEMPDELIIKADAHWRKIKFKS